MPKWDDSPNISPEEIARLQRDMALRNAARIASERDRAEMQRNAVTFENTILHDENRIAQIRAASNAVARSQAERKAIGATSAARTAATAFFALLLAVVVLGVCLLVWYANQQTKLVQAPTVVERVINNPAAAPSQPPTTTVISAPAPAPPSVTVNTVSPPPATPTNSSRVIVVRPPNIARSSDGGTSTPSDSATGASQTGSPANDSQRPTGDENGQ